MSEKLRRLAAQLSEVDEAIAAAPLYADPANPSAGFSDVLVELVARETEVLTQLADSARDEVAAD